MMIYLRFSALATLLAGMVWSAEYRGVVQVSGLALPGATVTASRGDTKLVTTTDEAGAFSVDLADGEWSVEVRSLGFAPLIRTVASGAATGTWELTFLPREALVAALTPGGAPRTSQASPNAPTPSRPNARLPQRQQAQQGQGQQTRPGFERLDVNQAAATQTFENLGALQNEETADLNQSAANSFLVQGSVSSAVGMAQQNDWGFRPGMDGMGPGMGFGPGMGPGMGPGGMGLDGQPTGGPGAGPTQDGPPRGPSMMPGGPGGGPGGPGGFAGRGGPPGGFGGGPGGRPGGAPGGGPGMSGRGGPVGDRGSGGRDGGRDPRAAGRPEWLGRGGATAFGNNRRDRRLRYMGMAAFNLNDSVWDARQFSVTGADVAKPDWSNLRGNFMLGGPLRIPKLISTDRQIMFMIDYGFGRNRNGTISDPVNMPTALERAGDFSQTAVNGVPVSLYDPLTNAPLAGNRIPASRLNSTATALLKFLPMPNLPFAVRNYQTSWTGSNDTHNVNGRLMNVRLTAKDRLNFSIGYQRSSNRSPNLLEFVDTGAGNGLNTSLGWSHTIRTRLINNVQVSFSRMRQQMDPFFSNVRNVAGELGIQGASTLPMNWGPPTLRFVNYASLTDGNFSSNRNQTFSIGDTMMWIHGSHNTSFGVNLRRMLTNQLSDANGRGTWSFNGYATALQVNGASQNATGYDLADFLLGYATTSSIRYGNPDKYFRNSALDFHMNDDWRIHPKFTLNYGVRWDYTRPVEELYDRLVNLTAQNGFATVNPTTPGGALPDSLVNPDRNNFSPRLGFALRPFTGKTLVIRGGYGVYYNTSVYNMIAGNMAQQPPFAQVLNAAGTRTSPLPLSAGFVIAPGTPGLGTYAVDPNYRVGYAQTWTLSLQRDLPFGLFGTVGYLGTKGTRLDQQFIPNSVAPGLPQSALPTGFLYQTSNGNSIYHAAQFQLNRRFRSGFGANASYQWSKSIDNAGTGGRGQGGTPVAQNWLDYSAERGLSSFDSRHNVSVQGQYSTGMGRAGGTLVQGWKGALLKDWTVSSMLSFRSGNPFTATVRSQVAGTAVNNTVRPNATGLPIEAPGQLFNTAAFTAAPPGQWGNAGRNTIPGPATLFLNGGVGRVFRFGERRSVDIQMQGQNVLNRVVITGWGTVVGALNYGLSTNAAQMRRLTLSVRFRF